MSADTKLTPDQAFDRDIPKHLQDDVMTNISEAAHAGFGQHGNVFIIDQDRIDSINVRAQGSVTVEGTEYAFIVEDGNWNGTVLEGWEHTGTQTFTPLPRTQWTLAPRHDLVSSAIAENRGPFLIAKWDAFLSRPDVAEIPRHYTYDRMMQPGCVIESHYRGKAEKLGLVLTDKENADAIRTRLAQATGEQP
jgi:hypothetical protein